MTGGISISWPILVVLRSATMKMKKVGVTLKVTKKTKQPFHNLKVIKKLLHHLNKYKTFWNAME